MVLDADVWYVGLSRWHPATPASENAVEPRSDWDTMSRANARGADANEMDTGHHYDYKAQTWVQGHDHAHIRTAGHSAPLMFCGADEITCLGKEG